MEEKVKENKVCVTGFTLNEYLFMLPALRSMMGRISVEYVADLKQLKARDYECDVICINCAINFYELELYFIFLEQKYGNSRPKVMCLATQDVPSESVEIMMKHNAEYIMIGLQDEEEFAACRKAFESNKFYRAKGSFNTFRQFRQDHIEIYEGLSKNQKYAFIYIMMGKTQKQFQIDFGFNSLNTAATHWKQVLKKFNVKNAIELVRKF